MKATFWKTGERKIIAKAYPERICLETTGGSKVAELSYDSTVELVAELVNALALKRTWLPREGHARSAFVADWPSELKSWTADLNRGRPEPTFAPEGMRGKQHHA